MRKQHVAYLAFVADDLARRAERVALQASEPLDYVLLRPSVERASRTLRAIAALSRADFGDQAVMLCRSLFEDVVVILWAITHPDPTAVLALYEEHRDATQKILLNRQTGTRRRDEREFEDARRAATRHWTRKTLPKLLLDTEEQSRDTPLHEAARTLRASHEVRLLNNLYLHHSDFGTNPWEFHGRAQARDEAGLGLALHQGISLVQLLLLAVVNRLTPERIDDVHELDLREGLRVVDRTGRNDPCWCGSGKKFKQCHAA